MTVLTRIGIAIAIISLSPSWSLAQFAMPLQRVDAYNDSAADLILGVNQNNVADLVGITDFTNTDNQPVSLQADDDAVLDGPSASIPTGSVQADGEAYTLTPISSTTSRAELDSAIVGQLLITPTSPGGWAGTGQWSMSLSGATEFEVLPHAEHGTPEEMTLRTELWGEATGLNTGDDLQFNAGRISVVIENVTQGIQVSVVANYNLGDNNWYWVVTDQNGGETTGQTASGFNETLYEDISGVQVGDRIRIRFVNQISGSSPMNVGSYSQQWTSKAYGSFQVIGQ